MIPKSECTDCKRLLWDDKPPFQPKPGMYGLCIYCGAVLQFDNDLKFIRPEPDKIPEEVKLKSELTKLAIHAGIDVEQVIKELIEKDKKCN